MAREDPCREQGAAELPRRTLGTRAGPLEYSLSGQGEPTIVLLSGAGMTLSAWQPLYPQIERLGRVFAWNRLGVQGSGAPPAAQRAAGIVACLRELLARAGVDPPYVLVGHSLGGLSASLFARLHPHEVAAVMFLESAHPHDEQPPPSGEARVARGLAKVQGEAPCEFEANLHSELVAAPESAHEVEAAGPFPPVPVAVITGGMDPPPSLLAPDAAAARRAHQVQLARLSPDTEHVIAEGSGHFPQRSEPRLVLDVLERLVRRARERP